MPTLTPREAIADALHRCLLGVDTNDHSLFASACLQSPDMTFIGAGRTLKGWSAVDNFAAVLFERVTMHMTSSKTDVSNEYTMSLTCVSQMFALKSRRVQMWPK